MPTLQQIRANRLNAAKSTGPRTPEGKDASRFNALKSGVRAEAEIIPNETKEALDALTAQFHGQFQPATPEEVALVDIVIRNEWLLRRMAVVEGSYWDLKVRRKRQDDALPDETDLFGQDLTRLQWRINSIQRNLFTALDRLRALQAQREAQDPAPFNPQLGSFGSAPAGKVIELPAASPADAAVPLESACTPRHSGKP
jgi:hypothetical protein